MFIIALIPALALFYLSAYYINDKYQSAQQSQELMRLAKLTKETSELIHNLQVERGISAGYLSSEQETKEKAKLLKQKELTDKHYQTFLTLISQKYDKKVKIHPEILHQFVILQQTRKNVIQKNISFSEMLNTYNKTNAQLINLIKMLTLLFHNPSMSPLDIYNLELLKEKAGQERAYMYHLLLSKKKPSSQIFTVHSLNIEQKTLKKEFQREASKDDKRFYNIFVLPEIDKEIDTLRQHIFQTHFNNVYAKKWFQVSTKRINELEKLSLNILKLYLHSIDKFHTAAKQSFYLSLFMWILSIFAFVVLTFIVNRLINKQARLLQDLQIASYTFNSHEAIAITDTQGIMIKVNKAFSEITGYSQEESIGKSTTILKSFQHDDTFYKQMWSTLTQQGYWSGEVQNRRKNGELYFEKLSITAIKDSQGEVTNYIAQFMDISELKEAQKRANYQAEHDFLTELPNRKSMINKLQKELARAKRHDYLDAFLFIDLDGFKQVNDTYGHNVGDILLLKVARIFKNTIREEDYAARISGDEFAIILVDLSNKQEQAIADVSIVAQKLITTLNKDFNIQGNTVHIGASIGIEFFPTHEKNKENIIRNADSAMYLAKRKGKNQFVFYK